MDQAPSTVRNKNKRTTLLLAGVVVLMFGFGFAMVPLYNLLCQVTGTQSIAQRTFEKSNVAAGTVDKERVITVKFDVSVNPDLPWDFKPATPVIQVHPGEITAVDFIADNRSSDRVTGQAIPSLAPWQATPYFSKLECFCFNRQTLDGNQQAHMPLRFMVSTDLPKDIHSMTLSYSFMRLKEVEKPEPQQDSELPSIKTAAK